MDEVKIHLSKNHPIDVHCDDEVRPCNSFLLLANVPADPPAALLLTFGDSSAVGNLFMTFWQRSVHESPEMAWVLESVARGIIQMADAERKQWPEDDRAGGKNN